MIGKTSFLARSLAQQSKYGAMVSSASRGFAGGGAKKPAIDPKCTDFDMVIVGGLNGASMTKHLQANDEAGHLKMAFVSPQGRFVEPTAYFPCAHGHADQLKLQSPSISGVIDTWSKREMPNSVASLNPETNSMTLKDGKAWTYKSLVLAPGFDHSMGHIKGLEEMANGPEDNGVNVHMITDKDRVDRNYWHGWNHQGGDMICYSPASPYKGEGSDFYALYYESFMRQDKMHGRASANARIQYWTPNKEIYQFGYANEVALEECAKRGIDVMFGWEMLEVKYNEINQKIAVFRNVDTNEVIEKDFLTACITPPSKPHEFLSNATGMLDAQGGVDINKYTMQHKTYENVFAFGDCIGGNTTRTQTAAYDQAPVLKNNVLAYMNGRDCNAIYDGYSYFPMYLGQSYCTAFSHLHDYEPAPRNHMVPHYGIFSNIYFSRQIASSMAQAKKFSDSTKNHGPPHYRYAATFDDLEHNELLKLKGIDAEEVRHPNAQARIDAHVAPEIAH